MVMYFIPLLVIVVAYTCIMCEISKKSKETGGESYQTSSGRMRLRRSDISQIERARSRTLRMTITIVAVFVWCWTPYVVMTLWYMFDRDGATKLPTWLQDAFFVMAVSNSCMNPVVYGSYALNFRRECCRCLNCFGQDTNQNLTRKSTDGGKLAAGQASGFTGRILKCFLTFTKVGSGATRSTGIVQGMVITRSPQMGNKYFNGMPPKNPARIERPPSVGHISFLSEPATHRGYRSSFHSEPCPCPDERHGILSHQSSESASMGAI